MGFCGYTKIESASTVQKFLDAYFFDCFKATPEKDKNRYLDFISDIMLYVNYVLRSFFSLFLDWNFVKLSIQNVFHLLMRHKLLIFLFIIMDVVVFLLILKVANSRLKKLRNLKKDFELKIMGKESHGNKNSNNEISCNKNKIFKDEKLIKSETEMLNEIFSNLEKLKNSSSFKLLMAKLKEKIPKIDTSVNGLEEMAAKMSIIKNQDESKTLYNDDYEEDNRSKFLYISKLFDILEEFASIDIPAKTYVYLFDRLVALIDRILSSEQLSYTFEKKEILKFGKFLDKWDEIIEFNDSTDSEPIINNDESTLDLKGSPSFSSTLKDQNLEVTQQNKKTNLDAKKLSIVNEDSTAEISSENFPSSSYEN
jgi:hypothetical protein